MRSPKTIWVALRQSAAFFILTVAFLLLRLGISQLPDNQIDITSDPYFYASAAQKLATVSIVLLKYLRLMFFPEFLSFDYGYLHIPYTGFSDPWVWVSVALHMIMLFVCIREIVRRKSAGFFLLAYLGGIFLISNLLLNVGPIMADRFLFLPSLFLLAAVVLLIRQMTTAKKGWDIVLLLGILVFALPFAYSITRQRVAEWKDSLILYKADLVKVPNSFRANAFNAMEEINLAQNLTDVAEQVEKYRYGIDLMEKAHRIYPDYKNMYFKWGIAYYGLGNIDSAEWAWGRLKSLWPDFQFNESNNNLIRDARYNQQMAIYNANFQQKNYPFLARTLNAALSYKADMAPVWTLLGKVYYLQGKSDSARWAFTKAIELNPPSEEDKRMLNILK